MTLTLMTPDVADAIVEEAERQGRSREELAFEALKRLFLPQEDLVALLADDASKVGAALSEQGFLMVAEGTRHIWDTPEEDKAWAHL